MSSAPSNNYRFGPRVERECSSKRRYASMREAEAEVEFMAKYEGRDLRPYQCIWCHGVHLSSSP